MDRDGIRSAKAEVFAKAFNFEEAPSAQAAGASPLFVASAAIAERLGATRSAPPRDRPAEAEIALGVAPARAQSKELALAILIQSRSLRQHPIVERALAIAKNEARVVYTGPVRARVRHRPLALGCSIAHIRVTAGTLGAFVKLDDGALGVLSNNHVLAAVNRAKPGDEILQPGKADRGRSPADVMGTFERAVDIGFGPNDINLVDGAVARVTPGTPFEASRLLALPTTDLVGTPQTTLNTDLLPEDEVFKVGRTTGLTRGRVFATEVENFVVNMGAPSKPQLARFDQQILIYSEAGQFSKGGDSGSMIYDSDNRPAALLFAGSSTGVPGGFGFTAANPIETVLSELQVSLHEAAPPP